MVGALHHQHSLAFKRCHGNDVAGAHLGAGAASHALLIVHPGQPVFNMNGVIITGPGAVAESKAAVSALLDMIPPALHEPDLYPVLKTGENRQPVKGSSPSVTRETTRIGP